MFFAVGNHNIFEAFLLRKEDLAYTSDCGILRPVCRQEVLSEHFWFSIPTINIFEKSRKKSKEITDVTEAGVVTCCGRTFCGKGAYTLA